MVNFKKITAGILSVIVCLCAAAAVYAVGTDELQISVKTVGSYELQIDMKNSSEYYLANVDIKVESEKGGAQVESYGFSAGDNIRVVSPGENVSAYATLDPASIPANTTKTPAGQQKPAGTTAKPVQNAPVQDNGGGDVADVYEDDTPDYVEDDVQGETGAVSADEAVTGTDMTGTEDATVTTSIHTIHSMSPGEETTVFATLAGGSESEPVMVMPAEEIPSYTIWIALGVVVVLGVAAFIVIKKKKGAAKDVASVIVAAILLTSILAGEGVLVVSAADDFKDPVAGSVSKTVTLDGGKGSITVTVDYTVVPPAIVEPIKSNRRPAPGDECDTPQLDERRIVAGAGPLTGHNIYVGDNDFMFYGQAIDDYTGKTVMNSARLNKLVNMMNDRDKWARDNGIKLYLVIAPNKSSVYPDYVPDSLTPAAKTNADAVVEALASGSTVEVIDLRQPLKNARSEYGDSLFYKYDTHWNNNGGFVGYTEVMRRINEDVAGAYTLKKSDFDISEHETYMKDMAYYLGYYSKFVDYGPVYTLRNGMTSHITKKITPERNGQFRFCSLWKNGYSDALRYVEFENPYNTGAPSIYMYRDSFSVSMLHFFRDSFSKSVFDWSYEFSRGEIVQSGADIVIMEVVEKQLEEFVNTRTFTGN